MKQFRPAAVMALGSICMLTAGGVAAADNTPQEKVTAKGYRLTLSMDDVNIQSVPNMAAAPLLREGFVTATVKLKVECTDEMKDLAADNCGNNPEDLIKTVSLFAQVGCAVQADDGIQLGPSATILSGLPNTLGALLPQGGDVTNINIAPTVQNLGPGSLAAVIKPGYISDVSIGAKEIRVRKSESKVAKQPVVSVTNVHVVVDQTGTATPTCLGPVAIRLRAQGMLKTRTSFDTVDKYGDLYAL